VYGISTSIQTGAEKLENESGRSTDIPLRGAYSGESLKDLDMYRVTKARVDGHIRIQLRGALRSQQPSGCDNRQLHHVPVDRALHPRMIISG
jgi:hypothetical protein